jgi:hypothetical protein
MRTRRSVMRCVWLACGAPGLLTAQAPAPGTVGPARDSLVRVSGVVRDTGFAPVFRARVRIEGMPNVMTHTNERGRFDLDSVPAGRRNLVLTRAGFYPVTLETAVGGGATGSVELLLEPLPPLRAAQQPGALFGTVMDTLGQPIPDAVIQTPGGATDVRTDSMGRYQIFGLVNAVRRRSQQIVRVRKVGLAPQMFVIGLSDTSGTQLDAMLSKPAQDLGTVLVRGQRVPARLVGFERRRRQGAGYFLSPEQVEQRKPYLLSDLFRTMPGVRVFPNGNGQPTLFGRGGCLMGVIIDGMNMFMEENNAAPLDALIPATDVLSVEVYQGGAPMPP